MTATINGLEVEISKLGPLTDRDVVLVTLPSFATTAWVTRMVESLRQVFAGAGLGNVPVFLLPRETRVEAMTDDHRRLMAALLLSGLEPGGAR